MNRSSKGFGLAGVAIAVLLMIATAAFSTSAQSAGTSVQAEQSISK